MSKTMLIVVITVIMLLSGCSVSLTGGVSADAFYPDIKTKDGGGFGDPSLSRHETTRPSTSHVRNNDGNATDKFLRRFFDTSACK